MPPEHYDAGEVPAMTRLRADLRAMPAGERRQLAREGVVLAEQEAAVKTLLTAARAAAGAGSGRR